MDTTIVQCPYCFEAIDFYVDPDTFGEFVEDCAVCCRPWLVRVQRPGDGRVIVRVERAQ